MGDKEILAQIINRSIDNALGNIAPGFRMFSSTLTKYVMDFLNPYIDAFTNEDGNLNSEAAAAFTKQEISSKVDEFMKKWNNEKM